MNEKASTEANAGQDAWIIRLRDRWFGDYEPEPAPIEQEEVPDTWIARLRDRWFGDPKPDAAPEEEASEIEMDHSDLPALLDTLRSGKPEAQAQAATALGSHGSTALEPLIAALSSEHTQVRAAAAAALGEIGDERAVPHLMDALRRCFRGRTGHKHRMMGLLAFTGIVLLGLSFFVGVIALKGFSLTYVCFTLTSRVWDRYIGKSRSESPAVQAIVNALTQIAERSPTPQLRAVVSDLEAVAADRLQQERETRETSRAAAQKIEALTERIKNLPLTAGAPDREPAHLPVPAQPAEPTPQTLPRVRT